MRPVIRCRTRAGRRQAAPAPAEPVDAPDSAAGRGVQFAVSRAAGRLRAGLVIVALRPPPPPHTRTDLPGTMHFTRHPPRWCRGVRDAVLAPPLLTMAKSGTVGRGRCAGRDAVHAGRGDIATDTGVDCACYRPGWSSDGQRRGPGRVGRPCWTWTRELGHSPNAVAPGMGSREALAICQRGRDASFLD